MVDALIELTIQSLLVPFNAGVEDSSNNSKDNLENTTK